MDLRCLRMFYFGVKLSFHFEVILRREVVFLGFGVGFCIVHFRFGEVLYRRLLLVCGCVFLVLVWFGFAEIYMMWVSP